MVTVKIGDHVAFGDTVAAAYPDRMGENPVPHQPVYRHLGHAASYGHLSDGAKLDLFDAHGYREYTG